MNVTKMSVNKITYHDFKLLLKKYGLSADDCQFGNDRHHVCDVTDDCTDPTEEVVAELKHGICDEYDMGRFLNLVARDKIIEPGKYMMYVSW